MSTVTCPNGHVSADPEWCDTCGARIGAAPIEQAVPSAPPPPAPTGSAPAAPGAPAAATPCPHCATMNAPDNLFCEQCGYDFTTGQAPPAPDDSSAPPPAADPLPGPAWVVILEIDPTWYALKGGLADQPCPPASSSTVSVTQHTALIGRTSQSRGIRPEVALDADTGVSRRHAQLVRDGEQLSVVDLSSTNGTYVVAAGAEPTADEEPIAPGAPAPLHDGDRIFLGAWSRLTVRSG